MDESADHYDAQLFDVAMRALQCARAIQEGLHLHVPFRKPFPACTARPITKSKAFVLKVMLAFLYEILCMCRVCVQKSQYGIGAIHIALGFLKNAILYVLPALENCTNIRLRYVTTVPGVTIVI